MIRLTHVKDEIGKTSDYICHIILSQLHTVEWHHIIPPSPILYTSKPFIFLIGQQF